MQDARKRAEGEITPSDVVYATAIFTEDTVVPGSPNIRTDQFQMHGFLVEAIEAGAIDPEEVGGLNRVDYSRAHSNAYLFTAEENEEIVFEEGQFWPNVDAVKAERPGQKPKNIGIPSTT